MNWQLSDIAEYLLSLIMTRGLTSCKNINQVSASETIFTTLSNIIDNKIIIIMSLVVLFCYVINGFFL